MGLLTALKIRLMNTRPFRRVWNNAIDTAVACVVEERRQAEAAHNAHLRDHRLALADDSRSRAQALADIEKRIAGCRKPV
ncbi:MAG: hypothetical protein AAGL24_25755 [Pseudomonadota bacterium]